VFKPLGDMLKAPDKLHKGVGSLLSPWALV
jgi:hypothetical protein